MESILVGFIGQGFIGLVFVRRCVAGFALLASCSLASCFPGFVRPSGYAEWVCMEEADTTFSLSEYVYHQLPAPALDRCVDGEVIGVIHEQLALVEALAFFSATVWREITCSTYIAHAHAQETHAAHA